MTAPTRKKRGRPEKPEGQARSLSLPSIRVNAEEMLHIETQAAHAGLSVSEYIRSIATRRKVIPRQTALEDKMLFELNRCGVNLNQIAKGVNRGHGLPHDMDAAIAELRLVLTKVWNAHDA